MHSCKWFPKVSQSSLDNNSCTERFGDKLICGNLLQVVTKVLLVWNGRGIKLTEKNSSACQDYES